MTCLVFMENSLFLGKTLTRNASCCFLSLKAVIYFIPNYTNVLWYFFCVTTSVKWYRVLKVICRLKQIKIGCCGGTFFNGRPSSPSARDATCSLRILVHPLCWPLIEDEAAWTELGYNLDAYYIIVHIGKYGLPVGFWESLAISPGNAPLKNIVGLKVGQPHFSAFQPQPHFVHCVHITIHQRLFSILPKVSVTPARRAACCCIAGLIILYWGTSWCRVLNTPGLDKYTVRLQPWIIERYETF